MYKLQIRLLMIALRTWSRFPMPAAPPEARDWSDRCCRYASLVGLLIALPCSLVYAIAGLWLPHGVAVLIAMAAGLALTGAIHERDTAALFDGLGAHDGATGALAAMRGPGRGALAILGLVMLLLTRFQTLNAIDPSWIGVCLVCAACVSRGLAVLVAHSLRPMPPANQDGQDTTPAATDRTPGRLDLAIALFWSIAPLLAAIAWTGETGVFVQAGATALGAAWLVRRIVRRRFGGHLRESFSAVQQFAELAFYLSMLSTLAVVDETIVDPAS